MVADEQPIICDGFSSTGDAVVAGTSSNVETDEGNDAGAAVGITFAVIVARRVE